MALPLRIIMDISCITVQEYPKGSFPMRLYEAYWTKSCALPCTIVHCHENSSMNIFTASVLNLTKAIFLGSIIYSGLKKPGKKPDKGDKLEGRRK